MNKITANGVTLSVTFGCTFPNFEVLSHTVPRMNTASTQNSATLVIISPVCGILQSAALGNKSSCANQIPNVIAGR